MFISHWMSVLYILTAVHLTHDRYTSQHSTDKWVVNYNGYIYLSTSRIQLFQAGGLLELISLITSSKMITYSFILHSIYLRQAVSFSELTHRPAHCSFFLESKLQTIWFSSFPQHHYCIKWIHTFFGAYWKKLLNFNLELCTK